MHAAVRDALAQKRLFSRVWLARAYCLGVCPRNGATVVISPGGRTVTEVQPADADELVQLALGAGVRS